MGHLTDLFVCELFAEFPVFLSGSVEFCDVVFLLDPDLNRSSVYIETEREENVHSFHSSVTGCEIYERITGRMTEVKGSRCVSRGVVDAVDLFIGLGVEAIDLLIFPHLLPAFLDCCGIILRHN